MSDRDTLADLIDELAWISAGLVSRAALSSRPGESTALYDLARKSDAVVRRLAGWRPPAREITTAEQLAELDTAFPCVIRENPADSTDFYPAMWEMGFQVGWCRAGQMYDPDDCTPTLPATVLVLPTEEASHHKGATLQCGKCGAVAHAPVSPDGRVPIQPLVGWTVIPDQHVVRCPSCPAEDPACPHDSRSGADGRWRCDQCGADCGPNTYLTTTEETTDVE